MPTSTKPEDGTRAGSPEPPNERVKTLYDTLGVAQTATTVEITTAYRNLALVYHPDRQKGSTERFQELQRAYEILKDATERSKYDALLKGKPSLKKFKRPAKLEKVDKPSYALLADLTFYQFEASPSKLRCSFHFGDGIQFHGESGSFIGFAADGYLYWTVNGRGYATQLCKADSDMALSNVRVIYRSGIGLARKPLERSRAGNYILPQQQQQHQQRAAAGRPAVNGAPGGGLQHLAKMTSDMPRMTEVERLKQTLRSKELHRSATKRLETLEKDETEKRNYLERELWEDFCLLQTNLEAGMRCVMRGLPVTTELARYMGYVSPEAVPLLSPVQKTFATTSAVCESPQTAMLWVDPLEDGNGSDDNKNIANDRIDAELGANANRATGVRNHLEQQRQQQLRKQRPPSPSSPSSPSSAPSQSDVRDLSDTGSDGDSCRAHSTTDQGAFTRTCYTAAYVSQQQSGSSPVTFGTARPVVSAVSSLRNNKMSLGQSAHLHPVSRASSPVAYALPAAAMAAHGLATDLRQLAQAPPTTDSTSQRGATVHCASVVWQRPTAATAVAAPASCESLLKVGSGQEISCASRTSIQDVDQPSLPASFTTPPAHGILPGSKDPAAVDRFVSLLQTTGDRPDNDAHGGTVGSPRLFHPWSTDPTALCDSQFSTTFYETISDAPGRPQSPSHIIVTAQSSLQREATTTTGSPATRGSPITVGAGKASRYSPSPQPTQEKASMYDSFSHASVTAATAMVTSTTDTHGRPLKPSLPQDYSPPAAEHGHAASGEGECIVKVRPFSASPTTASSKAPANTTAEMERSTSPRPVAPSVSFDAHKTAGPTMASGRSAADQSMPRGDFGDGYASYGVVSGAAVDQLHEEAPHRGTQSTPPRPSSSDKSAAGARVSQDESTQLHQQQLHLDVVEGLMQPPLFSRANRSVTMRNGDFANPSDAVFSGAAAAEATSGAFQLPSATEEELGGLGVAIVSSHFPTSQDHSAQCGVQENDLEEPPLLPNAAAAASLEKRRRSKGRVTPRYMQSTEAHSRRVSASPAEVTQSPRLEMVHAYRSMTAEEMLAEEEGFINSFAKTKRAI